MILISTTEMFFELVERLIAVKIFNSSIDALKILLGNSDGILKTETDFKKALKTNSDTLSPNKLVPAFLQLDSVPKSGLPTIP